MVLAVSQTKPIHRFDALAKPSFTASGFSGAPRWFIGNYLYTAASGAAFEWNAPNLTDEVKVSLRDLALWDWTLSDGITRDEVTNTFTKSGADGFTGATATTAIAAGNCSIEGKPHDLSSTNMIGLQSGSPVGVNFSNTNIEHALVFGQDGIGQIYERGVLKKRNNFRWASGDKGLIEHVAGSYDNFVRYYKISASGAITLLRSTRSLLSYPITPALLIYHGGGVMNEVLIWFGSEATANMQIYGVLSGELQDWQNQATYDSLVEKTLTKDKREDFTYFTEEKNLMSLALNLAWREEDEYQAFKEFFQYHDLSRPFIFVDTARHKLLPEPHHGLADNEMFANFIASFQDTPLGAELYGVSATIRQMIDAPSLF